MNYNILDTKEKRWNLIKILVVLLLFTAMIYEVAYYVSHVNNEWVEFVESCDCQCIHMPNAPPYPNDTFSLKIPIYDEVTKNES